MIIKWFPLLLWSIANYSLRPDISVNKPNPVCQKHQRYTASTWHCNRWWKTNINSNLGDLKFCRKLEFLQNAPPLLVHQGKLWHALDNQQESNSFYICLPTCAIHYFLICAPLKTLFLTHNLKFVAKLHFSAVMVMMRCTREVFQWLRW